MQLVLIFFYFSFATVLASETLSPITLIINLMPTNARAQADVFEREFKEFYPTHRIVKIHSKKINDLPLILEKILNDGEAIANLLIFGHGNTGYLDKDRKSTNKKNATDFVTRVFDSTGDYFNFNSSIKENENTNVISVGSWLFRDIKGRFTDNAKVIFFTCSTFDSDPKNAAIQANVIARTLGLKNGEVRGFRSYFTAEEVLKPFWKNYPEIAPVILGYHVFLASLAALGMYSDQQFLSNVLPSIGVLTAGNIAIKFFFRRAYIAKINNGKVESLNKVRFWNLKKAFVPFCSKLLENSSNLES